MKIRRIEIGDLETRVKWMNNPVIYANMGFTPPITLENTIKWYNKNLSLENRIDVTYIDDNNNIVGFGGITNIDPILRCGETYTFISPDFHGKGFGTHANQLLIDYAFNTLKLNKIISHVDEPNIASRRVREKLGFKLEGIIRDAKILNGALIDRYYYGLLKREYVRPSLNLSEIEINEKPIKIVRDDIYQETEGGGV